MELVKHYAENQLNYYEQRIDEDIVSAEKTVSPDYKRLRQSAYTQVSYLLSQFFLRQGKIYRPGETDISDLKLLDFGCGVGRVMEALVEMGCGKVDGCDISPKMLQHASGKEELAASDFFASRGYDAGDAPSDIYDIAYSFVCMHHISMRQTRLKILEDLARTMNDRGMICVELRLYPGISQHKIPRNHASWSDNIVSTGTNSHCDVWVTPDTLGEVYRDFSLFYEDVCIQETSLGSDHYTYRPDARYQYGCSLVYVLASKKRSLNKLIYG